LAAFFPRITLISGDFRAEFAANKKWAMSPLLSPPAGAHTEKPDGQIRLHRQNTGICREIQWARIRA
jgi:hypothetical protein